MSSCILLFVAHLFIAVASTPQELEQREAATLLRRLAPPTTTLLTHPLGTDGMPAVFSPVHPASQVQLVNRSNADPADDSDPAEDPETVETRLEKTTLPTASYAAAELQADLTPTVTLPDPIRVEDLSSVRYPHVR